jgi:hypothetical protein
MKQTNRKEGYLIFDESDSLKILILCCVVWFSYELLNFDFKFEQIRVNFVEV